MKSQILSMLVEHAKRDGDKMAFIGQNPTDNTPYTLTYRQLLEQVEETARHFQQHAARCIAIYAENCLTWLVADLAAMHAEIPCIPIPKFFSDSQIDHVLSQTQADLLIYDTCLAGFEPVGVLGELSIGRRDAHVTAETPAILPGTVKITFTSGSTGQPKGVCLSQANLDQVTDSLAQMMRTQPGLERHLVMLPLSTLLENITGAYVPLSLGVTSIVLDGSSVGLMGSSQFDAILWMKILLEYRPNTLVLTPALLHALIALTQQNPDVATSLGFVAVGGARVSGEILQAAHQLGIPAYEGYGLSECGSVVGMNTPLHFQPGSSGKVLPHVQVKIADDGEVWVKDAVALGYLGQPFVDDWLPTGDLGALDVQGFLSIQGRKKNQIITSFGRNISPEWIESEAQRWGALRNLIVVGESRERLSGVVLVQDPAAAVAAIGELNTVLPDYARICQLIFVKDPQTYLALLTANHRPKREIVEQQVNQWCADPAQYQNLVGVLEV